MLLRFTMQYSASKNLIYYIIVPNRSIYFIQAGLTKFQGCVTPFAGVATKETLRKVTGFPEASFIE